MTTRAKGSKPLPREENFVRPRRTCEECGRVCAVRESGKVWQHACGPHGRLTGGQRASLRSRAYVKRIRAKTHCQKCGAQPVDFHREEHVQNPYWRVNRLAASGSAIARIDAEIALCTPLCRRCHMQEDGRLEILRQRITPIKPPRPCSRCHRLYKPMRRGLCRACYGNDKRTKDQSPEEYRATMAAMLTARNQSAEMRQRVSQCASQRRRAEDGTWL